MLPDVKAGSDASIHCCVNLCNHSRAVYLDVNFLPSLVLLAAGSTANTHHQAALLAFHLFSNRVELGHSHTPELKLSVWTRFVIQGCGSASLTLC